MGTYTTNYNLFMPTIGEQGWGDLVNGNFTTIDNTMKGLSNQISTNANNISSLTTKTNSLQTSVNNLSASIPTTISYSGTFTIAMVSHGVPSNSIPRTAGVFPIYCSSVAVSGKVYVGCSGGPEAYLVLINSSGCTETQITTTATEYAVSNVSSILIKYGGSAGTITFTIGKPVFS